jgi:hypothetical protein
MRLLLVLAAAAALLVAPSASAKLIRPGDLRLCDGSHCIAIGHRPTVELLSHFIYSSGRPPAATAPALGAPYLQLTFRNGYVTGIAATPSFDRFLSYGVVLERFSRGTWYRLPRAAARELRRLARRLQPMPLTQDALDRAH